MVIKEPGDRTLGRIIKDQIANGIIANVILHKEAMDTNRRDERQRVFNPFETNTSAIGDKFFTLRIGKNRSYIEFDNTIQTHSFLIDL